MESPLKNNPDQQAASVQLPWIEQQQRDREALAAETDQAPPPESKDRQWKVCEKHNAILKGYACPLCKKELDAAIMPIIQDSTSQESAGDRVKRCILNLDSPSLPPSLEEYLECGCASCLEVYSKLSAPAVAEQEPPIITDELWNKYKPLCPMCQDGDKPTIYPDGGCYHSDELTENDRTGSWPFLCHASKQLAAAADLLGQLAVARRERDEAKSKLDAYIKSEAEHTDALAQKSAEALEGINALTAERDEARKQNTIFEEEMDAIRTVRDIARERCKKQEEQLTALATARDRLREDFANFRANIRQALFSYWPNNLGNTDEEIVGTIVRALTALATAQADIAKLCSVIAAAFAETAKPLNASVEYDATPTEGERLKKVQEILSSAIDAASATEGGQQG